MITSKAKRMALIGASMLTAVLSAGCQPAAISDKQALLIAAECAKHGKEVVIYNSPVVSRMQCVEVAAGG